METLNCPYSKNDLHFTTKNDKPSVFDTQLQSIWEAKMEEGCFRYKLGDLRTKCLPGKYNFIVQLNINRALERRKPQLVTDVLMEFNPQNFHFGKVSRKEVMFNIDPCDWEPDTCTYPLLINVSPLEYCHSLIVPCIENGLPQVLNFKALRMAVEVMLASNSCYFRIGFNSLGGFASVNNLHLHAYYLKYHLFLESAIVNQLKGPCYELMDFPSKGFVFEVKEMENILEAVRSVLLLTDFLIENKIAHNVFLTRAMPFSWTAQKQNLEANELHSLRIYVWARETCYGVKDEMAFNIAVCELAGHIPMKDENSFEIITENDIAVLLHKVCHATFNEIKERVKELY